MKNPLPWLVLLMSALANPAVAQEHPSTRAEEARALRERKASEPPADAAGRVEGLLNWIERGPLAQHFAGGRDGFGLRLGGIENGAGLALGPSWRASNVLNGTLQFAASGAASLAGDHELSATIAVPHVIADRLAITIDAESTHLAQERFYGAGMASVRGDAGAFALDTRRVAARATARLTDWLSVSGSAGTLRAITADANAATAAPISSRFTAVDAPGLGTVQHFAVQSLSATLDWRDMPQNPRRGGRYYVAAHRYVDSRQGPYSFVRIDAEAEQHLSAWKRQRMLTLRAFASTTIADDDATVPFYLQRTLGGSRLLRGFATDRFRDRSLLAVQAEYGWDLSPFINAVLFYEAGAVGSRLRDISANNFRRDYGLGFRFGSARTVALRTDVAFGSGEGTRFTMRFNHAF